MRLRRENPPAAVVEAPARHVAPAVSPQDLAAERERAREVAIRHHLELVDLRTVTLEPDAIALLPEATARRLTAIPV